MVGYAEYYSTGRVYNYYTVPFWWTRFSMRRTSTTTTSWYVLQIYHSTPKGVGFPLASRRLLEEKRAERVRFAILPALLFLVVSLNLLDGIPFF